jgi:DNA-directed RNA polymerase subunit RPC12/RpoP
MENKKYRFTCPNCGKKYEKATDDFGDVTCPDCDTKPVGEPEIWADGMWINQ